jgi:hypothetical protein
MNITTLSKRLDKKQVYYYIEVDDYVYLTTKETVYMFDMWGNYIDQYGINEEAA